MISKEHSLTCLLSLRNNICEIHWYFKYLKDVTNSFQVFKEIVEWVGLRNVTHMIISNATNHMFVGNMISKSINTLIDLFM